MRLMFTAFLLLLLPAGRGAAAQPHEPALPAYVRLAASEREVPLTDTLRALVVFVQFRDDHTPGDPCVFFRGWPLYPDRTRLPRFAHDLLATAPTPPFPDSSLTDYLYRQSNGRFLLYGDVFPRTVVTLEDEAYYHNRDRTGRPQAGGYGYLTREILDRIDPEVDFRDYDVNDDGFVDYLFVIVRRDTRRDDRTFAWTGISCLDARCGGGLAGGRPAEADLFYDGRRLHWDYSGSILQNSTAGNVDPLVYHVRLMAHELGHDLWAPFFVHVPGLTDNDVPENGTNQVGYVLMAGAGGAPDRRGDELISAFERSLLGWIACDTLRTGRDGLTLGDLYTTSACYVVPVGAGRHLFVTNRQRVGFFDRRRAMRYSDGTCRTFHDALLHTTGLLVHLVDGVRVDVLPADNTLKLSAHDDAYRGDLFSPETQSQLTPWTRPRIDGTSPGTTDAVPSWHALDRIRYPGDAGGTMAFDFVEDFRRRPVIRADSWMGSEVAGFAFESDIVVTNGATLHVQADIVVRGRLRVDPGARVVVAPGAHVELTETSTLHLAATARLEVGGTVTHDGLLRPGGRIDVHAGGTLRTSRL